jgi:hypothetical protein
VEVIVTEALTAHTHRMGRDWPVMSVNRTCETPTYGDVHITVTRYIGKVPKQQAEDSSSKVARHHDLANSISKGSVRD